MRCAPRASNGPNHLGFCVPFQVNQIGSITESIEAVGMAKAANWGVMASHRSGETEDSFIADLVLHNMDYPPTRWP